MRLLLISNSTNAGEAYLEYPKTEIKNFLGNKIKKILFIPYAAVSFSFDEYEAKVKERFFEIGYKVESIHRVKDAAAAVNKAEAIVVGGGNTWHLLRMLQENKLIDAVRKRVIDGVPYVGWSAGSNVACPTIRTTNDMPIIQPRTFKAFNLVKFQINPHYIDANPVGHAGETREDRIHEFIEINPGIYVVGLREGTMLRIENNKMNLIGNRNARIFKKGLVPKELSSTDDFTFLL